MPIYYIIFFLIISCPIFIFVTLRAKLFIEYNKHIDPKMYSHFKYWWGILISFDSPRIIFAITNDRKINLEKDDKVLQQIGVKLSKVTLYYFLSILGFVLMHLLIALLIS